VPREVGEAPVTRACFICAAPITRQSKSGRCRPCATRANHADPVKEARRKEAHRLACAQPEYRAKQKAARRKVEAERAGDPAWRAYKQASGRRLRACYDADEAAQAANLAKRTLVGGKLSERALAWCPVDRRADYLVLRDKTGAAEARRMIEAAMTPFERQLAKVASGAGLVAKPDLRTGGPGYTLGGVASGMI
jgi:hypothetical protein